MDLCLTRDERLRLAHAIRGHERPAGIDRATWFHLAEESDPDYFCLDLYQFRTIARLDPAKVLPALGLGHLTE